jgi:hypothetical protein
MLKGAGNHYQSPLAKERVLPGAALDKPSRPSQPFTSDNDTRVSKFQQIAYRSFDMVFNDPADGNKTVYEFPVSGKAFILQSLLRSIRYQRGTTAFTGGVYGPVYEIYLNRSDEPINFDTSQVDGLTAVFRSHQPVFQLFGFPFFHIKVVSLGVTGDMTGLRLVTFEEPLQSGLTTPMYPNTQMFSMGSNGGGGGGSSGGGGSGGTVLSGGNGNSVNVGSFGGTNVPK